MQNAYLVELAGSLNFTDAAGVQDQLREAFLGGSSVEVRTQDLDKLDLSIVQILISGQKTAEKSGKIFRVSALRQGPLCDVLMRAGLLSTSGEAPFEIAWA